VKRYFPIRTETACQLKWAWSTLYLNTGITRSCHRTGESEITAENFLSFHNTPLKIQERQRMLQGQWPEQSCSYCREIEESGGTSDRMRMLTIPDLSPTELDTDPTATHVDPTLVEVYFSNACNLGCIYCHDHLSSAIDAETKKYGEFRKGGVEIVSSTGHFRELVPYFWQWFETGFAKIRRLHVLGGEPFYQKEFDKLLEEIAKNPNPDCEFNVVTNLMLSPARLDSYIERFKSLLANRALKRIDITASIDCWGPEQEYVRHGLDLATWENNFQKLLEHPWLTLNINQTIMPLTMKTMPTLIEKLKQWRTVHPVGHFFSGCYPAPDYLKLDIFGYDFFRQDIEKILALMPTQDEQDHIAKEYMQGILYQLKNTEFDHNKVRDLIIYLDEKDRRRGLNWRSVFPWLKELEHVVQ